MMVGVLLSIDGDNPAGRVFIVVVLSSLSILSKSKALDLSALTDSPPGELPAFFREKNLQKKFNIWFYFMMYSCSKGLKLFVLRSANLSHYLRSVALLKNARNMSKVNAQTFYSENTLLTEMESGHAFSCRLLFLDELVPCRGIYANQAHSLNG